MTYPFYAPDAYLELTPEQIAQVANGCGPMGWRIDLVPDSLGGLDISADCSCHDYMYSLGGDEQARRFADVILYCNIAHKVLMAGGPLQAFRMAGAGIMYKAVRSCGEDHFGNGQ